jgi:AraC-like DNA-binding protein
LPTILVLPAHDALLRARLTTGLGRRYRLIAAASWSAVPGLMEREAVHAVVVDASAGPRLPFGELGWLRRQHPGVATVVVLDSHGHELELFRLGRQGVDGVVLMGLGELEGTLFETVERGLARSTARKVTSRLEGRAPPLLLEAIAYAVEHAHRDPAPADLASATAARTVEAYRRELRRAGLPPPSRILLWGRLFMAAHLLDRDDQAVDAVAHELGYSAGSSLARALRRETGLPPSQIRIRGGIACVLEALLASPDLSSRPVRGGALTATPSTRVHPVASRRRGRSS